MSFAMREKRGQRASPNASKVASVSGKPAAPTALANKPGDYCGMVPASAVTKLNGCGGTTRSSSGSSPFKPGAVSGTQTGMGKAGEVKGRG